MLVSSILVFGMPEMPEQEDTRSVNKLSAESESRLQVQVRPRQGVISPDALRDLICAVFAWPDPGSLVPCRPEHGFSRFSTGSRRRGLDAFNVPTMRKTRGWIDASDFVGSSAGVAKKTSDMVVAEQDSDRGGLPRKRSRDPWRRRNKTNDLHLWLVRHAPIASSMLAVHPKKVEEVRNWLLSGKGGILVLKGPSGCGKTATVRVLAKELQIDVQDWAEREDVCQFRDDRVEDSVALYDSARHWESRSKAFIDFLVRARHYHVLDGLERGRLLGKKLVLLDDIPTFIRRDPSQLKTLLQLFQSQPSFTDYRLVIIISDSGRDDNLSRKLLPEDVMAEVGVDSITFNGATTTNLIKTLRTIATEESRSGVRSFRVPDRDSLQSLAESSFGDIRGAINALQFSCLNDTSNLKKAFDGSSNLTKKQPSSRMKRHASVDNPTLSSIGGRDPALDTFHAIGKILYCKRQEDLLLKTRSVDVRFRRPPLISNPDEVLSRISMSGDSFTCFLHQSYPDFFSKLDDLAEAADHFSIADPFFHEWANATKICLSEYGSMIVARGLCFWNSSVAKQQGMKTFTKPEWFSKSKIMRARQDEQQRAFAGAFYSSSEMTTVIIPCLACYFPMCLPEGLSFSHRFGRSLEPPTSNATPLCPQGQQHFGASPARVQEVEDEDLVDYQIEEWDD